MNPWVRIPLPPSDITGPLAVWCRQVAIQLNSEIAISQFSGTDPNTSGFTGYPGSLLVNIGSASTTTRMWQMSGSVASADTNAWHPFRMA